MAAGSAKRVGVIGAGMVGVCAASYLQRDGHSVFLVDPGIPGEGASFGNAGAFNASSVTPMSVPGIIRKVPGWLRDPVGPSPPRYSALWPLGAAVTLKARIVTRVVSESARMLPSTGISLPRIILATILRHLPEPKLHVLRTERPGGV